MDPLSIAVGTLALAGIILALWAYPHLKDAFEEAFGDVPDLPEEMRTGRQSQPSGGRIGKANPSDTQNVAHHSEGDV